MKMILTVFFLFVLGLNIGETVRIHFYVPTPMTRAQALSYCTQYYTTLSIINSEEEHQKLVAAAGGIIFQGWIGLYRPVGNPNIWIWPDQQLLDFTKLYDPENRNVSCVYAAMNKWYANSCENMHPFFCHYEYDVTLVKLNKTWEDALIYCRDKFFDLASATIVSELEILRNRTKPSTTEGVWTGLRFLAGEWHWMSKTFKKILYRGSLPSCPEEPYRCGAHNRITEQWEMRDCQERLNFVCY
ncbi:hypothetical protein QQF64_000994 [Cirrhinus molitorella]|uniref:C-type lectin domain-containing protein n=1 Tax=Cirrhinus molitorella TaxID=172907 RepID=A0ABR3NYZ7_9TELE